MEVTTYDTFEVEGSEFNSDHTEITSGSFFSAQDDEVISIPSDSTSFFDQLEENDVIRECTFLNYSTLDSKRKAIQSFNSFVNTRKVYLDSLNGLKNWISGASEAPSEESIEESKYILDSFKNWLSVKLEYPIPKVVMGPVPSGGITLELRPNKHNAMFITVLNDSDIEIEVMRDDYFFSVDKSVLEAKPYLLETYENIINE